MISKIKGKLAKKTENNLLIEINGLGYDVLIPSTVFNNIKDKNIGEDIELLTFHYLANDPARSVPMLIGFTNQLEKEFFEQFITVSGVGPKAAVKAFCEPISNIIQAIESSDLVHLKKLPGIGEQRARQIIAKLQGKVGRFGLIRDKFDPEKMFLHKDIQEEAIEVLSQLQYKRNEAENMVRTAFEKNKQIATTEELLNEVYKQKTIVR